jgi:O-antigen ligase
MNWNADKTESLSRYQKKRRRLRVGLFIVMLCVYLSLVIVGALALSRLDDRMSTLFEVDFTQDHWLYRYLGKMDLGPRVSFWLGGWQVFESHPIFGVGLGNSGFFFMDAMPDYAWSFPEVRSLMLGGSGVLNPKNLWSRLLAETGIVGFFLFAAWMLSLWKTADELSRKSSPLLRQVGWMGLFVCAALTTEGFSVDSFALPYYWFSLGLVVSAYQQAQETSERL